MRSKEAIRNRLLSYTNQIWGTKKVEQLDPLVHILIEELVNELYLVQNRLYDIEYTIQDSISRELTEEKYIAVRPAHTVLQVRPNVPILDLKKEIPFTLGEAPVGFLNKEADAITFYPLTNTHLLNLKIDYLFHYKQLYAIDDHNKKQLILNTERQSSHNSIWLGIEIDSIINTLKGLSFFIDFPELSEVDELYGALPDLECFIFDTLVSLQQGIQTSSQKVLSAREKDILKLYHDNYFFLNKDVSLMDLDEKVLPGELYDIIDPEKISELKPMYWIKLVFSPIFSPEHLKNMIIAVNTFPVLNQKLEKTTIIKDNFHKMIPLEADMGEKFLAVEYVKDDRERSLTATTSNDNNPATSYSLKTVNPFLSEKLSLNDFIGLMLDKLEEERTAFIDFDKEEINRLLTSLTLRNTNDNTSSEKESQTSARIQVCPDEKTNHINIGYWLSYGELLNGIRAGKTFLPDKNSKLDGCQVISLCDIHGAKEFKDIQELVAIDRFIFNSRDQIITEYDIISFCQSELGSSVKKVEIQLTKGISIRPYEGITRFLEIHLTPSTNLAKPFEKGMLKSLLTRLKERSPNDYNYRIKIMNKNR